MREHPGRYRGGVGAPTPEQSALIERARAAHREHRYDTAYAEVRAARKLGALDPEDLHRLADAAHARWSDAVRRSTGWASI